MRQYDRHPDCRATLVAGLIDSMSYFQVGQRVVAMPSRLSGGDAQRVAVGQSVADHAGG